MATAPSRLVAATRHGKWSGMLWCVCIVFLVAAQAFSMTCEECLELNRRKAALEKTLNDERNKQRQAQDMKNVQEVVEINKRIINVNKDINAVVREISDNRKECEAACKPDVVQKMKCRKLMERIDELESGAPSPGEEQLTKIDGLYRDLQKCRKELKLMER
ncbi:MAG: hypothetical protein AB1646_19585 [Thermodesulfobacteriota bacterium]